MPQPRLAVFFIPFKNFSRVWTILDEPGIWKSLAAGGFKLETFSRSQANHTNHPGLAAVGSYAMISWELEKVQSFKRLANTKDPFERNI